MSPQAITDSQTFPTGESYASQNSVDCDFPVADKEPGYMPNKQTRRTTFTVPYKGKGKVPRGKCRNWENCPNCSLLVDCGQCRNCVDKSLK